MCFTFEYLVAKRNDMHHISNDRRTQRSAALIWDGMVSCLADKPFERVTVSDIQRESGIARSTFYRCFDNLSDVLSWRCEICFDEVLGSMEFERRPNPPALAKAFFIGLMEHLDILDILVTANRFDIIYACHLASAEKVREGLGEIPGLDETHGRYYMAIRTGVMIGILTAWLANGREETPDELAVIAGEQVGLLVDGLGN